MELAPEDKVNMSLGEKRILYDNDGNQCNDQMFCTRIHFVGMVVMSGKHSFTRVNKSINSSEAFVVTEFKHLFKSLL
jgi:hypothetical protein